MEGWLKGLIAVACVVIIAAGGYYFWGEVQASQQRQAIAKRLSEIAMCKESLREHDDAAMQAREDCFSRGLVTADEYWASKQPSS